MNEPKRFDGLSPSQVALAEADLADFLRDWRNGAWVPPMAELAFRAGWIARDRRDAPRA